MERNKKMESIFENIVPYEAYEDGVEGDSMADKQDNKKENTGSKASSQSKTHQEISSELAEKLSTLEKIELSLSKVDELDDLDSEIDAIATQALQSYSDLYEKATTFSDAHAGKVFEVSSQLLKTALDAKGMKLDRKLKTIELQLKKAKLDQAESKNDEQFDQSDFVSRDDILDAISKSTREEENNSK